MLHQYYIRKELCKGCLTCMKVCPLDAILQLPDHTLEINQERCDGCGLCYENCNLRVIVKKTRLHFVSSASKLTP
jgi:electron transport complex protein RnfB